MITSYIIIQTFLSVVYSSSKPVREFTDYYKTSNGDICVPVHHTLPQASGFIRMRVDYTLNFEDRSIPRFKEETSHNLVRSSTPCQGKLRFSTVKKRVREGNLNVYIAWDITPFDVIAEFHYEFTQELEETIQQIISLDGAFSISVELSNTHPTYMYMSPRKSELTAMDLLRRMRHDNRALCLKMDNNRYAVLRPTYIDPMPTNQISIVKVIVKVNGNPVTRVYRAYSCGSDSLPEQSKFKFVVEQTPTEIEFLAVSRKHVYQQEYGFHDPIETSYKFNISPISYSIYDPNAPLCKPESDFYLLPYVKKNRPCHNSRDWGYFFVLRPSEILFAHMQLTERISPKALRFYYEPLLSLDQCPA